MSSANPARSKQESGAVSYNHILLPTDGRTAIEPTIHHGLALGQAFAATIHTLHVVEMDSERWEGESAGVTEQKRWERAEATEPVMDEAHRLGLNVIPAVEPGRPPDVIWEYVEENEIDLIVMGTCGRTGLTRYLNRSICGETIRTVPRPVLAVPAAHTIEARDPSANHQYSDLLIPCDGSDEALAALNHGLAIARKSGATVHGLFVVDQRAYTSRPYHTWERAVNSWEQRGERVLATLEEKAAGEYIDARTTLTTGVPHQEVLSYTEENDIDLIAMGTRGLGGVDRFLYGSTADKTIRNASVPVLTAP